jgi:hypothetical protein
VQCEFFHLYRYRGSRPFVHDGAGTGSVLVGLEGEITVRGGGREESLRPGDVLLLPAALDPVECVPAGSYVMLECVPV